MNNVAIRAENLGKMYRIGEKQAGYSTLRDTVVDIFFSPLRRARSLLRGEAASDLKQEIWALRDVSFEIPRGEAVGIVGHNGAGKSTLLKILSRITEPTQGSADIFGRVGALLEVGTGFHPELTGRENLYLNGAILGMSRVEIDRKFDEIVSFAGVEQFIDTPVKHYSSGMGLRLGFAVAAHLEPEILVVDEVLAVGDAQFQKKSLGKMNDVANAGRTVLFVSHNMAAVQNLCRTGIWLDKGRVADFGPIEQVVSNYVRKAFTEVLNQEWERSLAPGNERIRIKSARVTTNVEDANQITMTTPILLEFEYWNLRPETLLNVSLHIHTSEGILLFNTAPVHDTNWMTRRVPSGLIRSVCEIPGYLLNSGSYRITAFFVEDHQHVLYRADDILTFDVAEAPEVRGAMMWFSKLPGVIHPLCRWTNDVLVSE